MAMDEVKTKTCEADKKKQQEREAKEQKEKPTSNPAAELGLLAQEVQKVFPELVHEDENGILSINYNGLIPVIIEALKEQNEEIEVLKALSKGASGNSNKRMLNNATAPQEDAGDVNSNSDVLNVESVVVAAKLEQNNPNPFSQSTEIRYTIPVNASDASINIYDLNGTQKKVYRLTQKGEGSITIESSALEAGMYLYTLIVDGKEIDTKRMILTN